MQASAVAYEVIVASRDLSMSTAATKDKWMAMGHRLRLPVIVSVFAISITFLTFFSHGEFSILIVANGVFFTVCTTVEHVIMQVFCGLEGQVNGSVSDYSLKV